MSTNELSRFFFAIFTTLFSLTSYGETPSYLAGVIYDSKSKKPIANALISVTHRGRWLFDLSTSQNGWFEAPEQLITVGLSELSISIIKSGYIFQTIDLSDDNEACKEHYCKIILKRIGTTIHEYNHTNFPTHQYHGYVGDYDTHEPIEGAEVQVASDLNKKPRTELKIIDTAYTRSSGFYTLNIPPNSRNATISVTKPGYGRVGEQKSIDFDEPIIKPAYLKKMAPTRWSATIGSGLGISWSRTNSILLYVNTELQFFGYKRRVNGGVFSKGFYSDPIVIPYIFLDFGYANYSQKTLYTFTRDHEVWYLDDSGDYQTYSGTLSSTEYTDISKGTAYVSAGIALQFASMSLIKLQKLKLDNPIDKNHYKWHASYEVIMYRW